MTKGPDRNSQSEGSDAFVARMDSRLGCPRETLAWSRAVGIADTALKTGARAPMFLLPDENGRLVRSQDLLDRGPLIISFFQGSWSQACVAELQMLNDALPAFRNLGASLLSITPETAELPRAVKRCYDLKLTILSDYDYGVSLLFGVIFSVPPFLKANLLAHGLDLAARHGSQSWMLPIPATYIVARTGIITAAFVEPDFRVRAATAAITGHLRGLERA